MGYVCFSLGVLDIFLEQSRNVNSLKYWYILEAFECKYLYHPENMNYADYVKFIIYNTVTSSTKNHEG